MTERTLLILAGVSLLAGCTPYDPGLGEAQRWNVEQHVIDPDPEYAGEPMEGGSGMRAAAAVDRYQRGEVKQPVEVTTTTVAGAGTGGSPQ